VGWAFQLQEPRFVLVLLLLVTAIALNLAGPVPPPGPQHRRQGWRRARGIRGRGAGRLHRDACTGPFMAAALGATLLLPALGSLLVFGALGLGLALPFLLLGWCPRPAAGCLGPDRGWCGCSASCPCRCSRPALGLAWVLGRQTGVDGMTLGLAAALTIGLALWWLGARTESTHRWAAAALLVAAVAAPMLWLRSGDTSGATPAAARLGAEPFAEGRLAQLRAERRPVFLYFTADWCITCKVNESGALASAQVASAFSARGVRVLEGDWTLGDPAVGRFLERHGRSGVPLYLYYAPGEEPRILPQILTASALADLAG
jgi:thiol:disulfide interchange protein